MFYFLNQTSFLLAWIFIWVLAAFYILRNKNNPRRWTTLAIITLAVVALYYSLIPRDETSRDTAELDAMIGQGAPVLLEFKSPH